MTNLNSGFSAIPLVFHDHLLDEGFEFLVDSATPCESTVYVAFSSKTETRLCGIVFVAAEGLVEFYLEIDIAGDRAGRGRAKEFVREMR